MADNEILLKLTGDPTGAEQAVAKVGSSVKSLEKDLKQIAKVSGVAFAGFSGAIGLAVNEFKEAERVSNQLNAVIRSTGGVAGVSAEDVKKLASEIQSISTFSDDAIIGSSNLLLTFKQVGSDVFPRAQKAIADVSAAMGVGLKEATIQVGKALNDPIQGISALSRVGITFTENQKQVIQTLVETGDAAGAQTIILQELESQFAGSAEAAAQGLGALDQLKNVLLDIAEAIGEQFAPFISEAAAGLKGFAESILQNEELIKRLALALGVGAAGSGLIFGVSSLGLAFIALANPVGIVIASLTALTAAAVFIVARFDLVKQAVLSLVDVFNNLPGPVTSALNAIQVFVVNFTESVANAFRGLALIIQGAFTLDFDKITQGFFQLGEAVFQVSIGSGIKAGKAFVENYSTGVEISRESVSQSLDDLNTKVQDFANKQFSIFDDLKSKLTTNVAARNEELVNNEVGMSQQIQEIDTDLGANQVGIYENATGQLVDAAARRAQSIASAESSGRSSGGGAKKSVITAESIVSNNKARQDAFRGIFNTKGLDAFNLVPGPGGINLVPKISSRGGTSTGVSSRPTSFVTGPSTSSNRGIEINLRGQASELFTVQQNRDTALGISRFLG